MKPWRRRGSAADGAGATRAAGARLNGSPLQRVDEVGIHRIHGLHRAVDLPLGFPEVAGGLDVVVDLAGTALGSHVTATSTCPATKAAPASPDFMFCSLTSASDRPFFWRTWARNHSDTEPWLTATFCPLRSFTVLMVFLARMPSPPTDASIGKTSTAGTPLDWARAKASTVDAIPSSLPAVSAIRRSLGSSTSENLTSRPWLFQVSF